MLREMLGFDQGDDLVFFDMARYGMSAQFGAQQAFSGSYGDGFDEVRQPFSNEFFTSTSDPNLPSMAFRRTQRPKKPLWRKTAYPVAPAALLIWQDGTVKQVTTLTDPDILNCDDVVMGGTLFLARADSWQAQVLEAAGFRLSEWTDPS